MSLVDSTNVPHNLSLCYIEPATQTSRDIDLFLFALWRDVTSLFTHIRGF